jgi:hypothetical protein
MRCLPGLLIFGLIRTSHFLTGIRQRRSIIVRFGRRVRLNGGLSISTIGSSNDYETAQAVAFAPLATFTLAQIDLALGWISGALSFIVWEIGKPVFLRYPRGKNEKAAIASICRNTYSLSRDVPECLGASDAPLGTDRMADDRLDPAAIT